MSESLGESSTDRPCWFVGASFGSEGDQTERFIREGVWRNGHAPKYLDAVRAIAVGDRIALKAAFARKNNLPFDARGHAASVMAIKATGVVRENPGDGLTLKVDWTAFHPPREWFFYTFRHPVWRVMPGKETADALIAFAFENAAQDLNFFRNHPYWRDRFGDVPKENARFPWTRFYQAVADKLLEYRANRGALLEILKTLAGRLDWLSFPMDQYADGTSGPLLDICPFTFMGLFNKGLTDANRRRFAEELAPLLKTDAPVPTGFAGIPVLNNQNSWFFAYSKNRKLDDIDALWKCFENALRLAGADSEKPGADFVAAFDEAVQRKFVKWNLTYGLYWMRPWDFLPLDEKSRTYIQEVLGMTVPAGSPKKCCTGAEYLDLMDALKVRFLDDPFPVHSFPELSLAAWNYKGAGSSAAAPPSSPAPVIPTPPAEPVTAPPYSVQGILDDGCFLGADRLGAILERLKSKKNLILQGPPGTGKTWLAKRMAYALMGFKDQDRARAVQFHPNMSYEDFVQGFRPDDDGRLRRLDGPALRIANDCRATGAPHVLIIEEINRGNPAQIFGELLTLLEATKRTPDDALRLCYAQKGDQSVHLPPELYVIGTMNVADRSLALVDMALRRRFAFIELAPALNERWKNWVHEKNGVPLALLEIVQQRIDALNAVIAAAPGLGPQFRVGHSFVTPHADEQVTDGPAWFRRIVETEIGPLLEEYWYDQPETAQKAKAALLQGV